MCLLYLSSFVILFTKRYEHKGSRLSVSIEEEGECRDSFTPSFIRRFAVRWTERGLRYVQSDMVHCLLNAIFLLYLKAYTSAESDPALGTFVSLFRTRVSSVVFRTLLD